MRPVRRIPRQRAIRAKPEVREPAPRSVLFRPETKIRHLDRSGDGFLPRFPGLACGSALRLVLTSRLLFYVLVGQTLMAAAIGAPQEETAPAGGAAEAV
jgi:hypothetical protein